MNYEFNQAMNPAMVVNLTGHGPVGGMDVDWLGGNLFWTLPQEGRIDYVSVDGLGHRVFKSGLDGLTMLAVNSENRCVGRRTLAWGRGWGEQVCREEDPGLG